MLKCFRKMTVFGVGPCIAVPTALTWGLTGWLSWNWPEYLVLPERYIDWLRVPGGLLILAGLVMLVTAAPVMHKAYGHGRLVTSGVYRIVRNPLYATWLVLVIPGTALYFGAGLLFLASVVGALVFRAVIGQEEEFLEAKFGDEFRAYRAQVHTLIPFLRP